MYFMEKIDNGIICKEILFHFLPSWWNRNYGIEYGERMVFDADYRVEMDRGGGTMIFNMPDENLKTLYECLKIKGAA